MDEEQSFINVFSGRKFVTVNLFFRKICAIKLALRRWLLSDVEVIRMMASSMIEKFDKYWHDINGLLAVATILDPRNKMDCVEFYFKKIYNDGAQLEIARIRKILDNLVVEYQKRSDTSSDQELLSRYSGRGYQNNCDGGEDDDEYAQEKKTKRRKVSVKCEVDHYLEDEPLPDNAEFNILQWWKMDTKYPTLRKIAKDILAIPVSTVASESAFSTGGRVVSPHRSRLTSTTVEALMCLQNWMMEDLKGNIYSYFVLL